MDMNMDSGTNSSMSMSMGIFHWTPISDNVWFSSWVPHSEGAYIGACIGLFLLTVLSRGSLAAEIYFSAWKTQSNMENMNLIGSGLITNKKHDVEKSSTIEELNPCIAQRSLPAYPNPLNLPGVPSFSFTTDSIRSLLTTLTSFIAYLLMLVVMTGNGGFFIAIIVGIFVGELAFGRFRSIGGYRRDDHLH